MVSVCCMVRLTLRCWPFGRRGPSRRSSAGRGLVVEEHVVARVGGRRWMLDGSAVGLVVRMVVLERRLDALVLHLRGSDEACFR